MEKLDVRRRRTKIQTVVNEISWISKNSNILPDDPSNPPVDEETLNKNELVFAMMCHFLDEISMSIVIRDAKDDGRKELKILRKQTAYHILMDGVITT